MAITTPTLVDAGSYPIERISPWAVNYTDTDIDTGEGEFVAARTGAGRALYLTHITMSMIVSGLDDTVFTLKDGDGTVLFGPITLQSNGGGVFSKDWKYPLKLTDNKSLCAYTPDYDGFTVYVEGFTADKPLG